MFVQSTYYEKGYLRQNIIENIEVVVYLHIYERKKIHRMSLSIVPNVQTICHIYPQN